MDGFTTERSFDKLVIGVLGLFVGMFSMSVCTTSHRQPFGQLVELNVCTVEACEYFVKLVYLLKSCGHGKCLYLFLCKKSIIHIIPIKLLNESSIHIC